MLVLTRVAHQALTEASCPTAEKKTSMLAPASWRMLSRSSRAVGPGVDASEQAANFRTPVVGLLLTRALGRIRQATGEPRKTVVGTCDPLLRFRVANEREQLRLACASTTRCRASSGSRGAALDLRVD